MLKRLLFAMGCSMALVAPAIAQQGPMMAIGSGDRLIGSRDFNATHTAALYDPDPAGQQRRFGGTTSTFVVPANQQWTPTTVTVTAGESLDFQVTGEIQYSPDPNDRAGSAGSLGGRRVPRAPIQTAFAGALIARVGNGPPFAIGNQPSVRMPAGGQLFLGINDDIVRDNSGQFQVTISQSGGGALGTASGGRRGGIRVPGNQQWTPTGITVRNGDVLRFQASGAVRFSPDPEDRADPQGAPKRHTVAGSPLPSQPGGSLIGRIDNSQPFWIGNQSAVTMPADGVLYLGINDDNVNDNTGQFNVVIMR